MRLKALTGALLFSVVAAPASKADVNDVALTLEQVQRLDIKIEPVRRAENEAVAVLPGTVIPALNARIVATAPFAGTVKQVHVLPGQRVVKGTPLATISSRELLEAQSQLSQAEAELQMAEAISHRKRVLVDKNFQSPAVAEEAEAQVARVKAVLEQHKRTLALHAITIGQGGEYILPAPQDGTVVEVSAMPGAKVDAMAAALTLDTSAELWVEVQIPANLVRSIKPGDAIEVIGGPEGRVVSLGGSLERTTRSASLYASVPADSGLLPGQLVSINILRATVTGALSVPATAVTRFADRNAVFVRNDGGFTLTPVEVRGQSMKVATIVGELSADAHVAASGIPQLEQMLQGQ
jgi:RND family efflux transporter MFP subunit